MAMVIGIEVSAENGFLIAIYDEGSGKGVYGLEIPPSELEEAIIKGIRYKISMESMFNVQELDTGAVIDGPPIKTRGGVNEQILIDPFLDEDEDE